ncbi:Modification methylase CcrMI [Gracilariopsis chorda]|uniref:Modification methylase CcrMI n=1 Tax=Gracilariopsis chorda TaxID=448386 RepID=A0A2V3IQ95_9FLOR|nr:Modification methylase CcrMI [Gracilariopsis chorda]|eukprot:PXF44265.1 Modification methylase CcrMI [Gracilariopsis chorda]
MVNYDNFDHVHPRYPGYHAVIDEVPQLVKGTLLQWSVQTSNGEVRRRRVRPEPKCRALLKKIICRLSQPGDMVVDMFAGTFSTAMACMELSKHRKFVGSEQDAACFAHAKHAAVLHFARTIQLAENDIPKTQEVRGVAHTVAYAFPETRTRLSRTWTAPKHFQP